MLISKHLAEGQVKLQSQIHQGLGYPVYYLVFESPVRSGFLMPRGVNRNRSAFSPEVKRPDRTAKRPQTAVFCGL
ncbi:uncharacterized protein LACBIDRAFT_312838 [Laccaria bicolor S238N-H82]|uniref:Predicted protein n=1 Tax=Laccaria bicolor (strain S238N-H82 / ATCC MYA-4686) TaxID=486041 RepID=B0DWX4_LACBS|nr:uncharacterized protein LACBIDRAFT_312838 [Laccaria bicolor S238N-H82]EDR00886.1 predicted protein [Laccaria bicolor S238N-H82]|eukprot:XP_001888480.1 predicted protein [Laccaria bicolor S238N-H82]